MSKKPLYKQIASQLRDKIMQKHYLEGERLPNEPQLAKEMNVARTTLREALYILEDEGLIVRRKGAGSFVVPRNNQILEGIEKLESYTTSIRRSGYKAEDKVLSIREIKIQSPTATQLKIPTNSLGFMIESIRLANNIPVIYSCEILPQWVAGDIEILQNRKEEESLLVFLKKYRNIEVLYSSQRVHVTQADSPVSDVLEIPAGTSLLKTQGISYNSNNEPVYTSNTFFRSELFNFIVIRRA